MTTVIPYTIRDVLIDQIAHMHCPPPAQAQRPSPKNRQEASADCRLADPRTAAGALLQAIRNKDEATVMVLLFHSALGEVVEHFLDGKDNMHHNKTTTITTTPFHMDCPVHLTEIILLFFWKHSCGSSSTSRHMADLVNCRDYWDDTPLLSAAANGESAHVALFLQHGADVTLRNCEAQTPLLAAIAECWDEGRRNAVVRLLLQHCVVHYDERTTTTTTMIMMCQQALELAVAANYVSTVKLLLQALPPEFRVSDALVHLAFEAPGERLEPMLDVLLQYGANIHARDETYSNNGKTMLQKAMERNDEADERCLRRYGATHWCLWQLSPQHNNNNTQFIIPRTRPGI